MAKRDVDESEKLFAHLASGEPMAAVYLVIGDEDYVVEEALALLARKRFGGGAVDALSWEQYRAGEKDFVFSRALDSLRMVSMFGGAKVVILRDAEELKEADLKALAEYVKKPAGRAHLAIFARKVDQRKGSWSAIKKGAFCVQCSGLSDYEVEGWIQGRAKALGLNLSRDAVEYLALCIGPNRAMIARSLEKIQVGFLPGQAIRLEDVQGQVVDTRERSIFELTRAISKRNLGEAMAALGALIAQNQEPIAINAMIARQARMMLQVKLALGLRLSEQEILGRCKIAPFAYKEYREAANRYSLSELYRLHSLAFEADRELKSVPIPKYLVLENLLLKNAAT